MYNGIHKLRYTFTYLCNDLPFQAPKKHVAEKPARAVERQVMEMERKNRTYTLLEDSESDEETVKERGKEKKSKDRDKGKKRKHLRKKRDESSSSSEEDSKKRSLCYVLDVAKNTTILLRRRPVLKILNRVSCIKNLYCEKIIL